MKFIALDNLLCHKHSTTFVKTDVIYIVIILEQFSSNIHFVVVLCCINAYKEIECFFFVEVQIYKVIVTILSTIKKTVQGIHCVLGNNICFMFNKVQINGADLLY